MSAALLPLTAVVYVAEVERLAAFYGAVLGLAPVEAGRGFAVLAGPGVELALVAMPPEFVEPAPADGQPPPPRETTPIKLSFLVPAIEACRPAVTSGGGTLKAPEAAWTWRGQRHLDATEPEGNVFQLREPAV